MDKRTLLAFLLAGVVLIAWSILFPPASPPPEPPGAGGSPVSASEPADRRPELVEGVRAGLAPSAAAAADTFATAGSGGRWEPQPIDSLLVETDLLRAGIHTHGGGLTRVELKLYPNGFAPGPVDLVRAGHEVLDLQLAWGTPERRRFPLGDAVYSVRREERAENGLRTQVVVLNARHSNGLAVTRSYTFQDGTYEVRHAVDVVGLSGELESPGVVIGWRAGIPYTEADRGADEHHFAGLVRVGDEVSSWAPGKFKNGPRTVSGAVRWVAVSNKYFLAAMVPAEGTATVAGADGDPSSFRNSVWLHLPAPATSVAKARLMLYLGPKDLDRVTAADPGLREAVSLGYRWMRPLSGLMLGVLKATYRLIPNYGLVIIVLSLLIRVLLFPLNQASMRSMKAMQRLQPEMEALRKKYAGKPQEMNRQLMLLYQKHKVNPVGGCLPMVVQMPILFALYFALMFAIDLRMAPFVGWIHDLSAPDTVGHVAGFPIHVLPLIMTAVSVLQARTTPTDPRQAALTTLMPFLLLVFFYSMPSGLVLYWTMTSLSTWVQQAIVNRSDGGLQPAGGDAAAVRTADAEERGEPVAKGGEGSKRGRAAVRAAQE